MKLTLSFWELICLFGAVHGIFLAFVLFFHERGNRIANRILSVLILAFSLRLMEIVAFWTKYLLVFPHITSSTYATAYLFSVLLYLYAKSLTSEPLKDKRIFLHFFPFVVCIVLLMPYYLQSSETKLLYLENYTYNDEQNFDFDDVPLVYILIQTLQFPQMFIYILLTVKLLKRYARKINASSQSIHKINLASLRKLSIGFGYFFGLWLLYNLAILLGTPYYREIDYFVTFSMAIWIYAIGYTPLRRPEIFSGLLILKTSPKYEKSTLTPEKAEDYVKRLVQVMEMEKPFTDSNLKLQDLSKKLSIPPHHLSQIINEKLNQNFFDFVNRYRIEELKKKLTDPKMQKYTLVSIAYEVGFNNKTTFNTAFKKHTGMTPTQFKKNIKLTD